VTVKAMAMPMRGFRGWLCRVGHTLREGRGHRKGDLGLSMTSHYADRESMEAKAACVRAVRLPR
jgi:hypothetical protein